VCRSAARGRAASRPARASSSHDRSIDPLTRKPTLNPIPNERPTRSRALALTDKNIQGGHALNHDRPNDAREKTFSKKGGARSLNTREKDVGLLEKRSATARSVGRLGGRPSLQRQGSIYASSARSRSLLAAWAITSGNKLTMKASKATKPM